MSAPDIKSPLPVIAAVLFALAGLALFTYLLVSGDRFQKQEEVEVTQNDPTSFYIKIDKSERTLALIDNGEVVKQYQIGLGFAPKGDKQQEGDGKTPEGEFYICMKNPNSQYHLSLGLSYPNEEDAIRGLDQKIISEEEAKQIASAIKQAGKPPWKTALGGEIFIHGHGASSDWTLGCVALENDDIEELYALVEMGTPVKIYA